ncbi:hypothetical protein ACFV7Q_27270 [Streptomyces sp. NPDC059851]|uniref:hypothetical protein n=1 Tax=Streptomyces sp. NPDC059851 TaxID=3346971 RepID=UPI003658F127
MAVTRTRRIVPLMIAATFAAGGVSVATTSAYAAASPNAVTTDSDNDDTDTDTDTRLLKHFSERGDRGETVRTVDTNGARDDGQAPTSGDDHYVDGGSGGVVGGDPNHAPTTIGQPDNQFLPVAEPRTVPKGDRPVMTDKPNTNLLKKYFG